MYAALYCAEMGQSVLILETDPKPFMRATYINQARVHMGYHYPRSLTTALKSAAYFKRFCDDFSFCIHDKFDQVYATSEKFSWTSAQQFRDFCSFANIRCEEISPERYFKQGMCDGAFLTQEYTYDAGILRDYYLDKLGNRNNVSIKYGVIIKGIEQDSDRYSIELDDGRVFRSSFVLNATYAGVNQIIDRLKLQPGEHFDLKYELCEIILCKPSDELKDTGITVMDGPFFSVMPFGKTGYHSLTAVTFTPHVVSYDNTPSFGCQDGLYCSPQRLGNCDQCPNKPASAWQYMSHLADKYL
ncbi:MAG: FAD-binding oxidoreductase, partial [Lachnospiraceae bacterium]|nr:FAD-binding oxidoreductase [Lachnospiraceae bacterium]